jgi:hypothetical protein
LHETIKRRMKTREDKAKPLAGIIFILMNTGVIVKIV